MRPLIKPALRPVWRDEQTLQLGVDPDRAVVIAGIDPPRAQLVEALDGSLDETGVQRAGQRLGLSAGDTDELLAVLVGAGAVDDAAADPGALRRLPLAERDRLAPDLAALSVAHGAPDGALSLLAARRGVVVAVHGAGRVGAPLAALLASAGIGHVLVVDTGVVRPRDLAPGGHRGDVLGRPRDAAALEAARSVAPATHCELPDDRVHPDVVVLAGESPADPIVLGELVRDGVDHLVVELREASAVVGPLVLPGRSSCRRCHDLQRSERDPMWPRVAAQLSLSRPTAIAACDVGLAALVAAMAALQVLAHVDGGAPPPSVDGTLELRLPGGEVRRRSWTRHPACGCGWPHRS